MLPSRSSLRFDVEHVDHREMMPPADLEVVEVVGRRDLHRAGALLRIGIVVADDLDAAADQRQHRGLADQVLEALVVRMHRDRGVAEHGFRPRGRDHDELVRSLDRILDVPEIALDLDLLHFEIGNGGEQLRVPIDQALVLVDQPFVVELDEHLEDGPRQALVHGEALARPVAGCAEPLELVDDDAAELGLPLPHPLDEFLAAHDPAGGLLALHELALDHHLGGDAGVIGARLPQHVAAAHALEPAQHVLQRVVEGMPHVQGARDIGRRDDDAIGLGVAALGAAGTKRLRLLPGGPDTALDFGRLIGLFNHCGHPASAAATSLSRHLLSTPRPGIGEAVAWGRQTRAPLTGRTMEPRHHATKTSCDQDMGHK